MKGRLGVPGVNESLVRCEYDVEAVSARSQADTVQGQPQDTAGDAVIGKTSSFEVAWGECFFQ